jgi:hypothetical protein
MTQDPYRSTRHWNAPGTRYPLVGIRLVMKALK